LTPKKDSWRFNVDSRTVNQRIVPMAWTMPFLDLNVENVASKKAYAKLDADNGYFQIPTHLKTSIY
jgi:hypothetical protein